MRIQGDYNEEERELTITVYFEDDDESKTFNDHFVKMVKEMAESISSKFVDVLNNTIVGSDGEEEADLDQVRKLLRNHLSDATHKINKTVSPEYYNKFL